MDKLSPNQRPSWDLLHFTWGMQYGWVGGIFIGKWGLYLQPSSLLHTTFSIKVLTELLGLKLHFESQKWFLGCQNSVERLWIVRNSHLWELLLLLTSPTSKWVHTVFWHIIESCRYLPYVYCLSAALFCIFCTCVLSFALLVCWGRWLLLSVFICWSLL